MFEWLFGRKKGDEDIKEEMRRSFERVKSDINSVSNWINHLNNKDSKQELKFSEIDVRLSSIESEIEGIKNMLAFIDGKFSKRLFKQKQTAVQGILGKQTAVEGVQMGVQTGVQTGEIHNLSVMERALVYVLLNSDMKLSYDDLAAMLGKTRTTIRGQINSIKQKTSLIEEIIEKNGKKRVFVPDSIKEELLKSVKVRVSKQGKRRKISEIG